jgi:tRNA (cytidine32/uridine32-2'-O)-methyltransferase
MLNQVSLDLLKRVRVVLVNTSHPGNIGGAARAMKNMGVTDLTLVDPREYPSGKAYARSASANDVLERATVVPTLEEALVGCGLVVGASARERGIPWPMLEPRSCGEKVVQEACQHDVALVFGREDSGLSNEELQLCTYHVHIPSNPECSSLNLAAAVQVICYEVRMAAMLAEQGKLPDLNQWDIPPAKHDDLEMYYQHLEQAMIDIEFHNPDNPRQTMARLRRLYGRIRLDRMELSILRGMLTAIQRVARQSNEFSDK